jgi:drug/metabolite transporter (DMT)-like permease
MITRLQANSMLMLAALFWGVGNVSQKTVLEDLGPLLTIGLRCLIALAIIAPLLRRERHSAPPMRRQDWQRIAMVSAFFALAATFLQMAYGGTSVTNASFLVNTTVVFTPLLGWLLLGERPARFAWPAIAMALGGALLMSDGWHGLGWGDALCLVAAILYSVWMVLLGQVSRSADRPLMAAAAQFACAGIVGTAAGLAVEPVSWHALANALPELLFLGVLSTGVAYTLQAVAQQAAPATDAAIITSGESIFGAVAAAALLGERMTATAAAGAALIMAAIILVQLPLLTYGTAR